MRRENLTIAETRWRATEVEPLYLNGEKPAELSEKCSVEDDETVVELRCTVCGVPVETDRASVLSHYHSDWHKYNLSRTLHGKSVITEDEFDQKISDDEEMSEVESESEDEDETLSKGVHHYFVQSGEVFSLYNAILIDTQPLSSSFFTKPLNCAIFLVAGGNFSGALFRGDEMLLHKSYRRYTVRAKQGGSQSAADARGHKAKSAGATLRRYNEKMLKEDIQDLIVKWTEEMQRTPLIFIRCSTYHRSIFVGDKTGDAPLLKNDPRLRTIPFETRKPCMEEVQRTWFRLRNVSCHGSIEEFRLHVIERNAQRKNKRRILRKNMAKKENYTLSESSDDEIAPTKQLGFGKSNNVEHVEEPQEYGDGNEEEILTKVEIQSVYSAIRSDSDEQLRSVLESSAERRPLIETYIKDVRFPPNASSFLHIAAGRAALRVLTELLSLGCDPSVKNSNGVVPYQVSLDRPTRQAFSQFRMDNSDRWDWDQCQVPELVVMSEEQLTKLAEKKRILNEKKRQRNKAKKAEERVVKAIQAEKDAFLALPDREKRAVAAERRLAQSLQTKAVIVADDGNRCFKCGCVLPAKPFEYSRNQFCTIPCLHAHRRENPAPPVI